MEHKFKVGDRVRICTSRTRVIDGPVWVPEMDVTRGKCGAVTSISNPAAILVRVEGGAEEWYYHPSWLTPLNERESISTSDLHVGDKVRIKSREWWDAQPKDDEGDAKFDYTPNWFTRGMAKQYCGKIVKITRIGTLDSTFQICGDGARFSTGWIDEIVERAKPESSYELGRFSAYVREFAESPLLRMPTASRHEPAPGPDIPLISKHQLLTHLKLD